MCHPSLLLFTCSIFPKHGRPQLDTVFQTWSNLGLCTLASISGNAFCTPRFHLPSCYWLKFLYWTRWSHDQVISRSVIKWPIRSSVKSNWWSPAVQNKSLGLVRKCMTLNFILFFSFHWYYPSPQGHFFFSVVLQYDPSLYWQHLPALCHQYISLLHSYFLCQGQEWKY